MPYDKNKKSAFFRMPYQSNPSLKEQNSYAHSLLLALSKVAFMMHVNLLHDNVKMGVIRLKVLVFINPAVQWHILTHSESTVLSRLCIDSAIGFYMSVMHFRIKNFPLMKYYVSVHDPIIYTGF